MPEIDEPPSYDRDPKEEWTMEVAAKKTRKYIRDIEERNELLMGEVEHDWDEIYDALEDAISAWNSIRPMTTDTMESLDRRAYRYIRMRAAAYLLKSAANKQARNQIQYNDQGFQVSENDKAQMYLSLANQERKEFEQKVPEVKKALNIESFWGGVHGDFHRDTGH